MGRGRSWTVSLLPWYNTTLALELSSPLSPQGIRRGKAGRNKKDSGLDSAEDRRMGIHHKKTLKSFYSSVSIYRPIIWLQSATRAFQISQNSPVCGSPPEFKKPNILRWKIPKGKSKKDNRSISLEHHRKFVFEEVGVPTAYIRSHNIFDSRSRYWLEYSWVKIFSLRGSGSWKPGLIDF